jgi:hypothetical protein
LTQPAAAQTAQDQPKWKAKYGGLFEDENGKLKKLLAQAEFNKAMLREIAAKIVTIAGYKKGLG